MMQLRQADLTWHVAGDEVVVLDLAGSVYLKVNGTGSVLWEALTEPTSEAALTAILVDQYGIDESEAAEDVARFVADLRTRGLLDE